MAVVSDGVVTHAGRVLSVTTREQRVMSDVYADVTSAAVINDDGSTSDVHVKAHFECDTRHAYAVVDATPEALALMAARGKRAGAENAVKAATALVAKLSKAGRPVVPVLPRCRVGDTVMVTGKTPGLEKGSLLTVCWAGTSRYSDQARVGVLVNGAKVYCAETKVTRVASVAELEAADEAAAVATARNEAARVEALAAAEADLASALAAVPAVESAYQAALSAMTPSAAVAA